MSLAMSTVRDYKVLPSGKDSTQKLGNEFGELGQTQKCPHKTPELPTLRCVTTRAPAHIQLSRRCPRALSVGSATEQLFCQEVPISHGSKHH